MIGKGCDVMREQDRQFAVNIVCIATFSENRQAHCNEILILRYLYRNAQNISCDASVLFQWFIGV